MSLGSTAQKLRAVGVQTVGVIATDPERARFYFRFRPPRMPMGADPELVTHAAYGLPNHAITAEGYDAVQARAARELRRLNEPVPSDPLTALRRIDGYDEPTELDMADLQRHQVQLTGLFLIDRDGVVRYTYVECARDGLAGIGDMPTDEEILGAARAL